MTTKILGNQITSYTIDTVQLSNTATAAFAKTLAPKVLYANVASNTFTVLDDTAVNVGGGYIVVTGAEFQSGATVLIDTTPASAVTYVNSTTLQVQVPTKSAASYNLYVVNPDGGVGIKVSGITYSSEPAWVTTSPLGNQVANTAFGVNLSATGASSYSVAAGSTLPAGTTLAANGYFSGTVSISAETTYTFSVVATDAELQDSTKTFQVTVTVIPVARLYSAGKNNLGQLGLNNQGSGFANYASSPTQIGTQTTWLVTSAGYNFNLAVKTDGTLWHWGSGANGGSGLSAVAHRSSPTQIGSGTTWLNACAGFYTGFATKTDGTLWSWGQQDFGQAGLNLAGAGTYKSSPTQVGALTNWSKITNGGYHVLFVKTDGTLWATGYCLNGQLGIAVRVNKSSPTQVGTENTWLKAVAGQYHSLAIKTDGTLWAWGEGTNGRLGTNDAIARSSPVQIGSDTTWTDISSVDNTSFGIKSDGTLWSWGGNGSGQRGSSSVNDFRSSPVQVGTDTTWSKLTDSCFGFSDSMMAIKTNNTLWAWGRNDNGQLGLNTLSWPSSPVQVGSATNWSKMSVGAQHNVMITK